MYQIDGFMPAENKELPYQDKQGVLMKNNQDDLIDVYKEKGHLEAKYEGHLSA